MRELPSLAPCQGEQKDVSRRTLPPPRDVAAVRGERELAAIGRPAWRGVVGDARGDLGGCVCAVRWDQPDRADVPITLRVRRLHRVRDARTVRRDLRIREETELVQIFRRKGKGRRRERGVSCDTSCDTWDGPTGG